MCTTATYLPFRPREEENAQEPNELEQMIEGVANAIEIEDEEDDEDEFELDDIDVSESENSDFDDLLQMARKRV